MDWLDALLYLSLLVLAYFIIGRSLVEGFLHSRAKTKVKPWLLDEQSLEGFDEDRKTFLRQIAYECEKEIALMQDIASRYPYWATLQPIGSAEEWSVSDEMKEMCTPEMIPILEHFLQHISEPVTYRVVWDAEHDYEDVYETPVRGKLLKLISACREKEEKGV